MPSIIDPGGNGVAGVPTPYRKKPTAPNLGNYSQAAVSRAVARQSGGGGGQIHSLVSTPAPKPPPVLVPNSSGHYSQPQPPPPVHAGNIAPVAHHQAAPPTAHKQAVPAHMNKGPAAPAPVAPVPVAAAQPVVPGLDQYLAGDTTYQGQLGAEQNDLSSFLASQQTNQAQNDTSFAAQLRALQDAQTSDESGLRDEYAGRGLSNSGVYADALSQLQGQYLQSNNNLQTQQAGASSALQQALAQFQSQQAIAQQQAQADAIARRAAQYGLTG